MKGRRFYTSLRFKITVGAVLLLVLILGTFSYLQYRRHREVLLENLERSTTAMGQVITGSLQHAMLTRDFSEIQQIVDEVARQGEIVNLVLLNKEGEIRIAPKGEQVGTRLNQQDPTCQVCHRFAPEQRKGSVILEQPGGRIFRTMTPIENRPECYACHDPRARLNGVLLTDFSMATIDQHLATDLRDNLLWAAAAVLVTVVTINLLMSRLVLTRLERFVKVIQLFGRGDLGQRVGIRSGDEIGELADAFNRMAEGMQAKERENRQLYTELQHKETLRGQLLEKLIGAQEEERKRIARDLHDQLGATLSGLTLSLEAAEPLFSAQRDSLKERWRRAQALATQALEETHKLILDLRPVVLDDLGLIAAIRADAETRLQARGMELQFNVTGPRRRLPPELELTLFRIAQEAISNIAKHANARHVNLAFDFQDSLVTVTIEDDGQGFDAQTLARSEDKTRGLGLLGMAERAQLAGGSFHIESQVGRGTRIVVSVRPP
ncbi:MAG: sensor histidine kinase [Chloroflexi bacterium]|nr:sensor histidine kinase [Chloroflexota bacterium]